MLRPSVLAFAAILAACATPSCTQDFDQFHPGTSVFTAGAGGAPTGPTSSTSSAGHGGGTTSSGSDSSGLSVVASSAAVTSSSTGGSTTSSTGTGTTVAEDCVNGKDDDGDGAVDCADDDCTSGYSCVPNAPSGWLGPAAFYEGAPADTPACPGAHPTATPLGYSGLVDTPAVCSACTCAPPSGQCSVQPLTLASDDACGNPIGFVTQPPPGVCLQITPPDATKAMRASAPTYGGGGACAASSVTVTLPPAIWQLAGLACSGGGLGGGCSANHACAPVATAPFGASLCVFRSGELSCPAAFPKQHVFVSSVQDSRGCSPCACGAPAVTCNAVTTLHGAASCNGPTTTIPNDGSCVAVGNGDATVDVTVTTTGSCPASGGQPTGTLKEGKLKMTVCCAP